MSPISQKWQSKSYHSHPFIYNIYSATLINVGFATRKSMYIDVFSFLAYDSITGCCCIPFWWKRTAVRHTALYVFRRDFCVDSVDDIAVLRTGRF